MEPNAIIQGVVDEAAADVTVMGAAEGVITGIDQLVADAVAAALKNGATEAQLEPFVGVRSTLSGSRTTLAAAIAARTPADSEVPAALRAKLKK